MARPHDPTSRPTPPEKPPKAQDNELAPAEIRARAQPDREPGADGPVRQEDNTLAPAKTRARKTRQAEVEPQAQPILTKGVLPDAIARRYNAEPGLFRRHIDYYEGGGAKRPAFRDRGDRLVAFQTDPATVGALLAIARHRGWSNLEVRGDDVFRREIWMEAQALGLTVKGYRPRARDRDEAAKRAQDRGEYGRPSAHAGPRKASRLGPKTQDRAGPTQAKAASRAPAGKIAEPAEPPPVGPPPVGPGPRRARTASAVPEPSTATAAVKAKAAPDFDKGVTGVFLELGSAPYQNRQGASLTPFVRLDIGEPKAVTVWGAGLPQAVIAARARAGDTLTLRRDGSDTVVLGKDAPGGPKVVERNRWTAIAERFRESSAGTAARDPDLAHAQARLAVVETVAKAKLGDPKDRQGQRRRQG